MRTNCAGVSNAVERVQRVRDARVTASSAQETSKRRPREKAVGIYAAGLLLQLPVPGARFCCNSMVQVSLCMFNETLTQSHAAHDFCAISPEIARSVHSIDIDSMILSRR